MHIKTLQRFKREVTVSLMRWNKNMRHKCSLRKVCCSFHLGSLHCSLLANHLHALKNVANNHHVLTWHATSLPAFLTNSSESFPFSELSLTQEVRLIIHQSVRKPFQTRCSHTFVRRYVSRWQVNGWTDLDNKLHEGVGAKFVLLSNVLVQLCALNVVHVQGCSLLHKCLAHLADGLF